jgi:hypothetical protein
MTTYGFLFLKDAGVSAAQVLALGGLAAPPMSQCRDTPDIELVGGAGGFAYHHQCGELPNDESKMYLAGACFQQAFQPQLYTVGMSSRRHACTGVKLSASVYTAGINPSA